MDILLFVIQEVGCYVSGTWQQTRPKCADPQNCTSAELESQAEYDDNKDNFVGLKAKAIKAEGWLLDGTWREVLHERKGVRVRILKASVWRYGRAFWFPAARLRVDNPATWFENKIQVLRNNDWAIRGWATNDVVDELTVQHNYEFI